MQIPPNSARLYHAPLATILKDLGLLCHIVSNDSPRLILSCRTNHTWRDSSNGYTSGAILDLIEQAIVLALCDRVLSTRRLDRPDGACVTRFRYN